MSDLPSESKIPLDATPPAWKTAEKPPGPAERRFKGGTPALNAALAKAMSEYPDVLKKDSRGHHSSYLSLAAILDETRKPLAKHGLTLIQQMRDDVLETCLIHSSGEERVSAVPIPSPKGPFGNVRSAADVWQAWGTCKSYARRYEAQSMLGIAGGDEDLDDKDHSKGDKGGKQGKPPAQRQQQAAKQRQPAAKKEAPPSDEDPAIKKARETVRKAADACDTPGKLTAMAKRYKNRPTHEKSALAQSAKHRGWVWKNDAFVAEDLNPQNPATGKTAF